jgi:GTP-binding protein HflX
MNMLSRSDVFAENKLFATVDSTVRKVVLDNVPFLLSDTVGFIRKLPTRLIESFKSTLDEIREADLLVHVVDISHPSFEEQIAVVNDTLKDINAADKPILLVFNKIDQYSTDAPNSTEEQFEGMNPDEDAPQRPTLEQLQATYMAKMHDPVIFISAQERTNIDELRSLLARHVAKLHYQRYPNQQPVIEDQEE